MSPYSNLTKKKIELNYKRYIKKYIAPDNQIALVIKNLPRLSKIDI